MTAKEKKVRIEKRNGGPWVPSEEKKGSAGAGKSQRGKKRRPSRIWHVMESAKERKEKIDAEEGARKPLFSIKCMVRAAYLPGPLIKKGNRGG